MKRSEVNTAIEWARKLLEDNSIALPIFAEWTRDEWRANADKAVTIRKTMLGWDVTDYGLNDYKKIGGVLFTVRNGDQNDKTIGVPYAEKYILLEEGQALPTHFHYSKTEDIINRAGGVLALKLYNAKEDESIDYDNDVTVYMDGIRHVVGAGETVSVHVGGSITLTPYLYHSFWALKGAGDLVVGEVSSVNDDNVDNRFNPTMPRFGEIEEDEPVVYPLCNEYEKLLV
ncbi:MAG: D-lyxose/D-mannose family sugar isomerase [Clostridia bacterium]|jgi:D-lyxose ketol-isomerase|nr:D-lyxose/D-mannose family sugar isomerase [Clostridia bacterium]